MRLRKRDQRNPKVADHPKRNHRRNPRMRFLKRSILLAILIFTTQLGLHAQTQRLSDCITGSTGSCRGLAIRQVSATNAANTVRLNVPNVGRTLALTSTCSAGTAAITVTVSAASDFSNPLTIDTLAAAATVTKQYDVTTPGAGLAVSPLVFPYIQVSVATCGAGNTSTLYVAIKGV